MTVRRLVAVNSLWAGLGNRIRFTLSAQSIARAMGATSVWPTQRGVFEPDLLDLWAFPARQLCQGSVVPNVTEHDVYMKRRRSVAQLARHRSLSILGTSVLHADGTEAAWEDELAQLKPVLEISQAVSGLRLQLRATYVAVQIRAARRAHPSTLQHSPTAWFTGRKRSRCLPRTPIRTSSSPATIPRPRNTS